MGHFSEVFIDQYIAYTISCVNSILVVFLLDVCVHFESIITDIYRHFYCILSTTDWTILCVAKTANLKRVVSIIESQFLSHVHTFIIY